MRATFRSLFRAWLSILIGWRDAPVLERMRKLSARYPRYGYRRIQVLVERENYSMSKSERGTCGAKRPYGYSASGGCAAHGLVQGRGAYSSEPSFGIAI